MHIIFCFLAIMIIMELISKKNERDSGIDGEITFRFNKGFEYLCLISIVIMLIFSIVFMIKGLYNHDDNYIGSAIFAIFSFCIFLLYLLVKNKKIIYENDIFYAYNILNKLKKYYAKEIIGAVEIMGDGIILTFNNNSKLKIDAQMENYLKIKEILEQHNIECKDKNGNVSPKGW